VSGVGCELARQFAGRGRGLVVTASFGAGVGPFAPEPGRATLSGMIEGDAYAAAALHARGDIPVGVAAMRMLMASGSAEAARRELGIAERVLGPQPDLAALLTPEAFELVRGVLAAVDHERLQAPEDWAAAFDRACAVSPEASVALYSLGDAARLREVTEETCGWLAAQGVLAPARRVLEIGCGSGRFLEALAPRAGFIVGVDVSDAMAREARRRSHGTNAAVLRTGGRDLRMFADASFDLVLAVDSFPYLVKAGVAEAHLDDCARVLAPGGDLVILNWSYDAPFAPPATLCQTLGLEPAPLSGRELVLWDGVGFRFRKRAQGGG
jgi:SAM-dependent methyltransferase